MQCMHVTRSTARGGRGSAANKSRFSAHIGGRRGTLLEELPYPGCTFGMHCMHNRHGVFAAKKGASCFIFDALSMSCQLPVSFVFSTTLINMPLHFAVTCQRLSLNV